MNGNAQLAVMRANIAVLDEVGATDVLVASCPECGLSSFCDAETRSHLCGYCGYGPWDGEPVEQASMLASLLPDRAVPFDGGHVVTKGDGGG